MEDIEVPTEHLDENIREKAEESKDKWTLYLAISTAIMAVFAALGSLMAGHHSNEALIGQIRASDNWAYYQAKGIKYEITQSILLNNANPSVQATREINARQDKYKTDQEESKKKAEEAEKDSEMHLKKHITFARAVTSFQIAIAVSAIAILAKRKFLWYFGLALSVIGVALFAMGLM